MGFDDEEDIPEYNKDREGEEERPSYVITVYNKKKKREESGNGLIEDIEVTENRQDTEEERKFTIVVEGGKFVGLPPEIAKQLESSGID